MTIEQLYAHFRNHPAVSTDTRNLPDGCIFFGLKGERYDGNQFAAQALELGASLAVIDDPEAKVNERCILVPNALRTLQDLATHHRRQFYIPIIAIGGSNGKTTTKELVSAVLKAHYPCHATAGNFNNHIGVPLTLLSMRPETEVAVIEMGTNRAGDIAELCRITEPSHGLITNIGKEHLEGFGDLEGVRKAEGELFDYLAENNGSAFINCDELWLSEMAKSVKHCILYGQKATTLDDTGFIEVRLTEEMPYVQAAFLADDGKTYRLQSRLFGRHNFNNIMTAVALGIYFKVPPEKIVGAIEAYRPANNRSQVIERGRLTILLDAYNANPSSMKPALESLNAMPAARRIAVLGDMLELGASSLAEHLSIARLALELQLDQVVLVGEEFSRLELSDERLLFLPDHKAARAWLEAHSFNEPTVMLIKGSRGIRLEKVVE